MLGHAAGGDLDGARRGLRPGSGLSRAGAGSLTPLHAPVRWGILGTGRIARSFARDLALLPEALVVAVGSRSEQGARRFLSFLDSETGTEPRRGHSSYRQLVSDETVDAVYVATPHPGHAEAAALALDAGKAVLVEKPFTLNAPEARELILLARRKGAFLMEAMWTRFLAHITRVRALLERGALGEIVSVVADHGQWFRPDAEHRLFAPALGGGALLHLGIYPVEIDRRWYAPSTFTLIARDGGLTERYDAPLEGNGLRHQAAEVASCLAAGQLESPLMPLDETLAIMQTLDQIRGRIGLGYPNEKPSR